MTVAETAARPWSDIDLVAAAALLHDAGKVMQRAGVGGEGRRDPKTTGFLCPTTPDGRPTHVHVVYTEEFLTGLSELLPPEVPRRLSRGEPDDTLANLAARHHRPGSEAQQTVAEADRLSAGTDRAPAGGVQRGGFREVPLASLFPVLQCTDEDHGPREGVSRAWVHRLAPFAPWEPAAAVRDALFPRPQGEPADLTDGYRALWRGFVAETEQLLARPALARRPRLLYQSLDWLCARWWWSVPSSTIDEPDVSLYDHARVSAAFAAVLHQALVSGEARLVGHGPADRSAARYLLVAGDLSGIQRSLFALRSGASKGAARLLRGRSLRLTMLGHATATLLLALTNGHPAQILSEAGGRLLLLMPATGAVENGLEEARRVLDRWSLERYAGGLRVALAWRTCRGDEFLSGRYQALYEEVGERLQEAKRQPLAAALRSDGGWRPAADAFVLGGLHEDYAARGACGACGEEPGGADQENRGALCSEAHAAGSLVAKASPVGPGPDDGLLIVWRLGTDEHDAAARSGRGAAARLQFFDRVSVDLVRAQPLTERLTLLCEEPDVLRLEALGGDAQGAGSLLPQRLVCRHVPRVEPRHLQKAERAEDESDLGETEDIREGDVLPFSLLAREALVDDGSGRRVGTPLLGVLKVDVDRLGLLLSKGLAEGGRPPSVSRLGTLSRMLDWFFTAYLERLAADTAGGSTSGAGDQEPRGGVYSVYAGGDDALLVGDWRSAVRLAARVREEFVSYVAGNPGVTLSAGIALVSPRRPLAGAVDEAQEGLERAKHGGRDRVSLLGDTVRWSEFLELALPFWEQLSAWVAGDIVTVGLTRRLLVYARRYRRVIEHGSVRDLVFRAHLAYDVHRNLVDRPVAGADKRAERERAAERLRRLAMAQGDDELLMRHLAVPVQMALYERRAAVAAKKGVRG